jgi:hypothetical protein
MSQPVFLHITSIGGLWVSNNIQDTPAGTVIGTFRFIDDAKFQQIGTLTGTVSSNLAVAGATGKSQSKEIS